MDVSDDSLWTNRMRILNRRLDDGSASTFVALAHNALAEFGAIGDYIWKAPRLLDSETLLEKEKLGSYYPMTGDPKNDATAEMLRHMRWQHEALKLEVQFPRFMSTANLFIVVGLLETYCLRLSKIIEGASTHSISEARGRGLSKVFDYYGRVGLDLKKIKINEQINAAREIRNCLYHAEGLLDWSQNKNEIRRIVNSQAFLSKEDRKRHKSLNRKSDVVNIVTDGFGHRLTINNSYAHRVAFYALDYLIELADLAEHSLAGGQ